MRNNISNTPNMVQALELFFQAMMDNVHTILPGKVIKYDFKTQKATVQPVLRKKYTDNTILTIPPIVGVPVVFPRSGGASITFPVVPGDFVVLLFAERSIDEWTQTGEDTTPSSNQKFNLSDAIAIPGLMPFNQTSHAENNTDTAITYGNAKVTLKQNGDVIVDGNNIVLGEGIAKKLINETFKTMIFDLHVHPSSGAPPTPIPDPTGVTMTSKTKAV